MVWNTKSMSPFVGTIDGDGHTLTFAKGSQPLFDCVREAEIKNLNIKGDYIADDGLIANYIVDSRAEFTANIANITILSGTKIAGSGLLGGYASGTNTVTITDCTIESDVIVGCDENGESLDARCIGGIIGYMNSLNRYNVVEDNYYKAGSAEKGIGFINIIDTNAAEHETTSGATYINSEGTRNVIAGASKADHNRTDDPLGADLDKLVKTDEIPVVSDKPENIDTVKDILDAAAAYMNNKVGIPTVNSIGGEWMVIGLARSDKEVAEGYYDHVVKYVQENINSNEQLDRNKSTENSRVILALTALGYDVTDVDGHNLLNGLKTMSYLNRQGINGPIWALIAFDSHDYEIPEGDVTREKLIETILADKKADLGWNASSSATTFDVDMTAMALQTLAPYYTTNEDVKEAVDAALELLSDCQMNDGGYASVDVDGMATEQAMLEPVRKFYEENDYIPTKEEIPNFGDLKARFRTWKHMILAAGLPCDGQAKEKQHEAIMRKKQLKD